MYTNSNNIQGGRRLLSSTIQTVVVVIRQESVIVIFIVIFQVQNVIVRIVRDAKILDDIGIRRRSE